MIYYLGAYPSLGERIVSNLLIEDRWRIMLGGLYMTLEVSMLAILFATLWGAVICALRMSRSRWLRAPAGIYVELMRSLPLLVLLLVSFYIIFASSALSKVQVSVLCFSLYFGAYYAEIFRTGIAGVEKGQWEAGAALGMSKIQSFCNKYGLGEKMFMKLQHVVEETLLEIIPFSGPVHLTVDYSEKTNQLSLTFTEDNLDGSILALQPDDSLPLKLVRGICSSFTEPVPGQIVAKIF